MQSFGNPVDKEKSEPAHIQVRARLLDLLDRRVFEPGEKLPPEPQIAQRLGVSRMTANRAILDLVREGRLVRAKGRGTFVAEGSARLTRCEVVVCGDSTYALQDYYFGALYWGLHGRLEQEGISTSLVRPAWPEVHASPSDAVVAINPREEDMAALNRLAGQGARVVALGASWNDAEVPCVDSDNRLGGALAAGHLIEQGHRRIAFLGARPETSNTQDRLHGFREALNARNLTPSDEVLVRDALEVGEGAEARLLDLVEEGTTAVFAAGPRLALGLLATAGRAGLRVPNQLSIVGYDDPDFLSLAHPAITTVRQPLAEMAVCAAERLLQSEPQNPAFTRLSPQLVVRGSSAPPLL